MTVPLLEEENAIVESTINGAGPEGEIVAKLGSDSIQRSSMQTLRPGIWLNDEVINFFLKNCLSRDDERMCSLDPSRKRSHFFSSFFISTLLDELHRSDSVRGVYAYKNVTRWSKKVPGGDIFNLRYIFVPVNTECVHWTLAVIFMEEKKIQYFDSLRQGQAGKKRETLVLSTLLKYLEDEWKSKKSGEMDSSDWKLVPCSTDTPKQENSEYSFDATTG